ncbi:hypothetical protein SAMN05216267_107720, partial [Actinacidiphila rubida]
GNHTTQPLRDLYTELLTLPTVAKHIAGTVSHPAKTLLINHTTTPHTTNTHLPTTTHGYHHHLTTITGTLNTTPHTPNPHTNHTILIRPDGYIAYTGTNPTHLTQTLTHYLGTPHKD